LKLAQTAYDSGAPDYARVLDPFLVGPVERLVELAGARPRTELLDIATGTGSAARAAFDRGASVVAVDLSPRMVALARELSPGIDFQVADASGLPFESDRFDAVTCGLSLSHFGDVERALREALRVLGRRGRFVASTWSEGTSIPATEAIREIRERYVQNAVDDGLDEATWLRPESGSAVLRRAGFEAVAVQTELFTGAFASAEDALAWSLAWPVAAARLALLDPQARDSFREDARRAVASCDLSWRFAVNFFVGRAPAP
jgi:ubiquinone/menaquinone biosynthesis C-methylase UbiE